MRRLFVATVCSAALLLSTAPAGFAQDDRACSNAGVAGAWGYTKTGTLYLPTGAAVPFATLGILNLAVDGTLTGVNNGSVGTNPPSRDVLEGTFEVNPDCTGTATVMVYNQAHTLLRTIVMALVVDEDGRHLRGIVTSLALPPSAMLPTGMNLSSVITADAKRVFRNRGQDLADQDQ